MIRKILGMKDKERNGMTEKNFHGITSEKRTNKNGETVMVNQIDRDALPEAFLESIKALSEETGELFAIAYFAEGLDLGRFTRAMLSLLRKRNELTHLNLRNKVKETIIVAPKSDLLLQWMVGLGALMTSNIRRVDTIEEAKNLFGLED